MTQLQVSFPAAFDAERAVVGEGVEGSLQHYHFGTQSTKHHVERTWGWALRCGNVEHAAGASSGHVALSLLILGATRTPKN